jgi:hypothetical protein
MFREIPRLLLRLLPAYLRNKLMANPTFRRSYSLALAKDKKLCAELVEMGHKDQEIRNQSTFIFENWRNPATYPQIRKLLIESFEVDEANTTRMKEIVAKYGFPGKRLVGLMGTQAAWLLVQHADQDPAFQEQCLTLMEAALKQGDVVASNVAYLTDRVRISQGLPQIYGTQWGFDHKPQPIQDETQVNERRAEVGLEPIEIYAETMNSASSWGQALDLAEYIKCMEEIAQELPPHYQQKLQKGLELLQSKNAINPNN